MIRHHRVWLIAAALLLMAAPAVALAAAADMPNPGAELAEWLYNNTAPFFPLGLAAASLWFLFRREFTGFIGFVVFAALVAIFVYFPDSVKTFAKTIWDAVTG